MASISCRHIYKIYPGNVTAVKDFNLEIADKEFIVFVGPSGCGKSTTLRMIAGLEEISGGEMYIGDRLINDVPPKDRDIAMVFQNYALYPHMTVYENIAFPLKLKKIAETDADGKTHLRKMPNDEIDRRVRESAHFAGLTDDLLEKSPFALSGGQKRRVAIAGVIAMEPEVLVLDEPSAGLDPQGREELLANIREFHRARGTTVVLVSHSMEEIARNVDRIVVLSDGKVYMEGTPKQVFARAHELEQVGLDVPQVTKVAAALKARGLDIDTAVYTVEALEQKLLTLRGGASPC